MFLRLNRNVVALNPQELKHATYWGEFISCVEELADNDRWSYIGLFTPNDIRRMLDIEFVSEMVIGYLHGYQNKKDKLDRWYEAYEQEFEDRRDVENIFHVVLGEILVFFPDISNTRWRKKSDFYSLFLALAEHKNCLPLSREQRVSLRGALIAFAQDVDRFVRDPAENQDVSSSVKKYAAAVERAASNLANRRTRGTELRELISDQIDNPIAT